ncbi:RHS repeat-associated core domain-containing protein [bacterium]|nr:RHS repeat-associated core domain-containing protein [bacterium]
MSGYQAPAGNDNRLQTDGTYSYLYDAEGNLTEKRLGSSTGTLVGQYTWDHRNRLTKVEIFSETTGAAVRTVTHAYDLNNRRISRLVDEGSNGSIENSDYFYYDGENVALTLGQNLSVEHRYLHGPMVDQILADEAFNESTGAFIDTYWTLTDHQGSVQDVLSGPGVRHEDIRYDAFGRIVSVRRGGVTDPTKTPTVSYAYTGREWDPAINFQYNRNRWYDPSTGRWISQDPIGFKAGFANFYLYTGNDPSRHRDPSGLDEPKGPVTLPQPVWFKLPTGATCVARFPMTGDNLHGLAKSAGDACSCITVAADLLRRMQGKIRSFYQGGQVFDWLFKDERHLQFYLDRLTQLSNRCNSSTIQFTCGDKRRCDRRDDGNEKGVNAYVDWSYFSDNPYYRDRSVINIYPDNFFGPETNRSGTLIWELGRTIGFGGIGGSGAIDDPHRFRRIVELLCRSSFKTSLK